MNVMNKDETYFDCKELRDAVIKTARRMNSEGINVNSSGNVSVRCKRGEKEGFLITPTGLAYDGLEPKDLVFVELKDNGVSFWGELKPSSEFRLHELIYRARSELNAIVHTHSKYATILACMQEGIPSFHYMVAASGADSIKCSEYALFGTEKMAQLVLETLGDKARACLIGHHGAISAGLSLQKAFSLAVEVENLAQMWVEIKKLGGCQLLNSEQMKEVMEKFSTYGVQKGEIK